MVINKAVIKRIKEIIEKNQRYLLVSVLGKPTKEESEALQALGIDPSDKSVLERAYWHNYLNEQGRSAPSTFSGVENQQDSSKLPSAEAHSTSIEYLESNLEQLLNKHKADVLSRIEGLIQANNNNYKFDALQNLDRPEQQDREVKAGTIPKLKKLLSETIKDLKSDWDRIGVTETSNAISLGSADRIVDENKNSDLKDVYVYRINPNDGATCKYCRAFYIDSDGSPKVYRLSTILGNGSNYGKKAADWRPVAGATHPRCRDSQLIELRPGWKVLPSGRQTYLGMKEWPSYIRSKLES